VLSPRRRGARTPQADAPEAVRLELFTNRFRAVAGEMGEMLRRTALSTNVKERLDFSCALLDAEGRLVVNAPHIPVHLGALGLCVRAVARRAALARATWRSPTTRRSAARTCPDVTVVIAGARRRQAAALLGYVASRAHHAEIGGSRPAPCRPTRGRWPRRAW
jgi:5-oxoprolinase (ATP-hydrolysing)